MTEADVKDIRKASPSGTLRRATMFPSEPFTWRINGRRDTTSIDAPVKNLVGTNWLRLTKTIPVADEQGGLSVRSLLKSDEFLHIFQAKPNRGQHPHGGEDASRSKSIDGAQADG
jgi:hypothetical protein